MAFNIENFKAEGLSSGGARPSLFKLSLPDWAGSASGQGRKLEFVAKATQCPPSILGQVEIPYFGRRIKLIGDQKSHYIYIRTVLIYVWMRQFC